MKILSIFTLVFMTSNAFAVNSSRLLLSAFCPNVGSQSTQALNQSQQLDDIVEQLQNDSNCAAIASSTSNLLLNIRELDLLRSAEDSLYENSSALSLYEEEVGIERANLFANFESELRAELSTGNLTQTEIEQRVREGLATYTPSSLRLEGLERRVSELSIERLESQLQVGFDLRDDTTKRERVRLIQANIGSVFTALNTSNACTNVNESLSPYITSNLIGLASSVISGVAGNAVSLGADIINGSAFLLRNIKYTKAHRKIDRNEMKIALSCTFEGISNTYCRARDTINLIEFNSVTKKNNCDNDECRLLDQGISLLSKKSNTMNSWVNFILSGASPRNANQVSSFQNAIALRAEFDVLSQTLEGLLNGARTELGRAGAVEETVLRNLMEDLASLVARNAFSGGGGNDVLPYADFFQVQNDRECGAWAYFFSPESDNRNLNRPQDSQDSCQRFATRTLTGTISVAELQERVRLLNLATSTTVAFEVQLVSEENTSSILARYESIDNQFRTSPELFITNLLDYYSKLKNYLTKNNLERKLLRNLITRAENQVIAARDIINTDECETFNQIENIDLVVTENCDLESTKVANLSLILAPNQQVLSVENSLRAILRDHIEIAKINGDISDELLLSILSTSTEDSSNLLVRNDLDIQGLYEDSTNAMSVSSGNLRNFWGTFSKVIFDTAKTLKKEQDHIVLGRLCVRAALSPLSKKYKSKLSKYCRGSVYKSTNRKVSDIYFDDIIQKDFKTKACEVYDFQRKLEHLNNL